MKINFFNFTTKKEETITPGKIYFAKTRDVKSPNRGNNTDAGIDFFVPKFNASFIKDLKEKNSKVFNTNKQSSNHNDLITFTNYPASTSNTASTVNNNNFNLTDINNTQIKFDEELGKNYFILEPLKGVLVPSGIKVRMENGDRALIAFNKSGVATKHQLVVGSCVIDSAYCGEVHIHVINDSAEVVRIYEDMKLTQFIELPIFVSQLSELTEDEYVSLMQQTTTTRGEKGFGKGTGEGHKPLNS